MVFQGLLRFYLGENAPKTGPKSHMTCLRSHYRPTNGTIKVPVGTYPSIGTILPTYDRNDISPNRDDYILPQLRNALYS